VLRWAFCAAVLLWFAYAAAAGRYFTARVACVFATWSAVVAAVVWLLPPVRRPPRRFSLVAFAIALTLLLGELSLRALAAIVPGPLLCVQGAGSEQRMRAHAFAVEAEHFGFPINAHGCYDEPFAPPSPERGRVIAAIGDSFHASFVPHEFHYTTVAERELGDAAVWNVGWAALGPAEYHVLLERDVLPLDPDAVVVSLFLGNDLAESPPWTGFDLALARWFDGGNVLLLEVPRRLVRLVRGTVRSAGAPTIGDLDAASAWLHDPSREPGTFAREAFLELEAERADDACTDQPARWGALVAELRAMRELCGRRPFGCVLIPDEFMVEDALWAQVRGDANDDNRWLLRDRLVAWCRDEGIPCFDLLPVLRAVPPLGDGDRHLYLLRDTHWNVRGNQAAGEAVAPFLRRLLDCAPPRSGR
jgi:hypothetical protein